MNILENYQKTQKIVCELLDETQTNYLNDNIAELQIYKRKENAIMCYSCKQKNIKRLENCNICETFLSPIDPSITSIFTHK